MATATPLPIEGTARRTAYGEAESSRDALVMQVIGGRDGTHLRAITPWR